MALSAAVILCFAADSKDQFLSLATTDDAATLYVATNFNLAGSAPTASYKIFVNDSGGFHLYADQFPPTDATGAVLTHPWVSGDGSEVTFQMLSDARLAGSGDLTPIQVKPPDRNPLFQAAPGSTFVSALFPWFPGTPRTGLQGIPNSCVTGTHADGSALSSRNPARGADVVTLSMIGLGAVSPPVPTGQATPADPPSMVQHQLTCSLVYYPDSGPPVKAGDIRVLNAMLTPARW